MRYDTIPKLLEFFGKFLNRLAPFIIALTLLVFMYGLFRMILGGGEQAKKEGRQIIVFGVVGLAVMLSVWGLVNLLKIGFGFSNVSAPPQGPGVPRFK